MDETIPLRQGHDEFNLSLKNIPEDKASVYGLADAGSFHLDDENENLTNGENPSHGRLRTMSLEFVLEEAAELMQSVSKIVTETVGNVKEEIADILEEDMLPVKPREEGEHSRKLSAIALAILEALVTAELGLAYPEPSGAIAWIEEAFVPCAGLLCGYLDWVSGATDNAIYPSLFLEYLLSYIGRGGETFLQHPSWCFCFSGVISAALALINYMGLEVVGILSIVVCVISMSPFLLLSMFGLPKVDLAWWLVFPTGDIALSTKGDDEIVNSLGVDSFLPVITIGGVLWRPFVNSLFWNMNSFDVGASFAGEVQDPERVFPKAMFLSVSFVVFSYLLPVLIALGASDLVQSNWNAGYFTTVAEKVVGPWLAVWTVFAAAVSDIALFEAKMSGDAYQLMGMADCGLIPKKFCKRSRFGTPTNGILVGTFVIFCLGVVDFELLVEMLNFAYSVSLLMEFAAFVNL